MGSGGVRRMTLGEKRAEFPSGIVRLSRLTEEREIFGAGSRRRGLGLGLKADDGGWCMDWVVGCVWGGEAYGMVGGWKKAGMGG